jgi:DNA-directed RNA polymerase subunit alpha
VVVNNEKVLKAGDLSKMTYSFKVTNPDLVICHLDDAARFEIEFFIEKGRGYVPAEENRKADQMKDVIPIDAIFTPIRKVEYHIEHTRVGQNTEYESLTLTVQTDGTIHPQAAVEEAANIMIKHFSLLVDKTKLVETKDTNDIDVLDENMLQMRKLLKTPLKEMGLSVRALNCLKAAGVEMLADLVRLKPADMADFRNFGKKSMNELQTLVESKNLTFGMDLTSYNLNDR